MTQTIESSQFPSLLQPGMRVYVGGSSNEPLALIDALRAAPERAAGVTFIQFPLPGVNCTDFTALHPDARLETYFLSPDLQEAWKVGRLDFVPMQLRRIFDHLRDGPRIDLALLQVAADGEDYRHGLNLDFNAAVLENCAAVAVEVNRALPLIAGAPGLSAAQVNWRVDSDRPLATYPVAGTNDESDAIGAHIAAMIDDGDCIQTGIGAIPCAVLQALRNHQNLGLHSGLLDEPCLELIEQGVINGTRKPIDAGLHVACMALGGLEFYERMAAREDIRLMPASHTHEVSVIAQLERFVSINSAVEIDLTGQVNAEMAGARQISGTGGSVDFMRAAATARHGRSIIALPSTARGGTTSRIVRELPAGAAVTALRTDIDYVVTEHGVASLRGKSLRDRREALIAIADPAFQGDLQA